MVEIAKRKQVTETEVKSKDVGDPVNTCVRNTSRDHGEEEESKPGPGLQFV